MSIPSDSWRAVYRIFDPTQRLEAVDMDLFVERPKSASEKILEDLALGLEPNGKWVLCGSMGSGKSSELVRLATLLGTRGQHATIGVDLASSAARVDKLTPPEALFLVGAAAVRAAGELWNRPVPEGQIEALARAFGGLLGPQGHAVNMGDLLQGVTLFAANVVAPGSAHVIGAATGAARAASSLVPSPVLSGRKKPQLGGLTRRLTGEGEADLVALQDAVNDILKHLAQDGPVAVLVDGLDKLQEIDVIRDLFATSRVLSTPCVPVIYTGPITLMLSAEWQGAGVTFKRVRLSNVVVNPPIPARVKISEDHVLVGRAAMRDVIARRLERRASLSIEQVFTSDALDLIITRSGGLLRDLIHLVNRAARFVLVHGGSVVDAEAAAAAVTEIRHEYEVTLSTQRVDELAHVRRTGYPSGNLDVSKDLLLWDYVLPYSNGEVWFEPHPILEGARPAD